LTGGTKLRASIDLDVVQSALSTKLTINNNDKIIK